MKMKFKAAWFVALVLGGVSLAQAVLFRGAGFSVVWPQFLALVVIGTVLFALAALRFRKAIGEMA